MSRSGSVLDHTGERFGRDETVAQFENILDLPPIDAAHVESGHAM